MKYVEYWTTNRHTTPGRQWQCAGVQVFEAYEAAYAQALVVVGGNCATVGLAGGYTQRGGHGPLASNLVLPLTRSSNGR